MAVEVWDYYNTTHGIRVHELFVGPFSTSIAQWRDPEKYYLLSLETTPYGMDVERKFKTILAAEKYYIQQLRKQLKQAERAIKIWEAKHAKD